MSTVTSSAGSAGTRPASTSGLIAGAPDRERPLLPPACVVAAGPQDREGRLVVVTGAGAAIDRRHRGAPAEVTGNRRRARRALRTNPDDRLPADPLGRIEGGDRILQGRDVADVRPQSSV